MGEWHTVFAGILCAVYVKEAAMKRTNRLIALCMLVITIALQIVGCGTNKEILGTGTEQNTITVPSEGDENGDRINGTDLTITCLSVGSADAFIFHTSNSTVLIDTGLKKSYKDIQSTLDEMGISAIDAMILTHFDKDHIGSAAKLLENYDTKQVYTTYLSKDSDMVDDLMEALETQKIDHTIVNEDTTLEMDGVTYTIYPPQRSAYDKDESNNSSLCILVTDGERKFLFPGDAEEDRITELLSMEDLECDVLKLPHHGRYEDNLDALIAKVNPTYAIITSSEEEPADDIVLELLRQRGIETFLTIDGTVIFSTDGTDITWQQETDTDS